MAASTPETEQRRTLMALLARSPVETIDALCRNAGLDLSHESLRGPETGLVTVRGRIGGGGAPFNVGECTVTRATVRLPTGEIGHAYALGHDARKARISAALDALWQRGETRAAVRAAVLEPLAAEAEAVDRARAAETAATKVDFFTLVRGED